MKIVVMAGLDKSLVNFRGTLVKAMVSGGMEVVAAAPSSSSDVSRQLAEMGVRFVSIALSRAGLNPLVDGLSLYRLIAFFRREKPDVVLSYTIKPVIYGSIAASWVGVPRVYALITGLGAAFHTTGIKGRLMRFVAVRMYRLALGRCTRVVVQNNEIAEIFRDERIVSADKVIVVPGSGVDTDHFIFRPINQGPPIFLLLARMLRDKGVGEYVAAARLVKKQLPHARFLLVGDTDPNPAALSDEQLRQWNDEGVIEYRPAVSDVRSLLSDCSIYVLPSYHEGMPRSVLEAMATGRPVITTDTIGCRDTIIDAGPPDAEGIRTGANGLLVPVRSILPLVASMRRLAADPDRAARMGLAGRELAESRFAVGRVNQLMFAAMSLRLP